MEQVLAMGSELFSTILMGLLILLMAYVKRFLQQKITLIEDEKIQKLSMNALQRADDIAEKVVKTMQQTTVQKLKEASADGKLTKEEIEQIQKDTAKNMNSLMTEDLYDALEMTVSDVNLYMGSLIESKVLDLKKDFISVSLPDEMDFLEHEAQIL
ncbi:MAG: hypothetical protein Q4A78_07335 [Peptostreptococcaceae bacterium]|nr:hypothetical protein [Peptostreptococcaceae bacterium]